MRLKWVKSPLLSPFLACLDHFERFSLVSVQEKLTGAFWIGLNGQKATISDFPIFPQFFITQMTLLSLPAYQSSQWPRKSNWTPKYLNYFQINTLGWNLEFLKSVPEIVKNVVSWSLKALSYRKSSHLVISQLVIPAKWWLFSDKK